MAHGDAVETGLRQWSGVKLLTKVGGMSLVSGDLNVIHGAQERLI
jgi:hypothetical protein